MSVMKLYLAGLSLIKRCVHWAESAQLSHNSLNKLSPCFRICFTKLLKTLLQYINVIHGKRKTNIGGLIVMRSRVFRGSCQKLRKMLGWHLVPRREQAIGGRGY